MGTSLATGCDLVRIRAQFYAPERAGDLAGHARLINALQKMVGQKLSIRMLWSQDVLAFMLSTPGKRLAKR
jgi:hypothetical protein